MVDVAVTITALPDDGGATITDVEYRVNGGAAQSSGGTGSFNILGLASVNDTIELRAVNAVGAGPWSNTKNAGAVAVTINSVTVGTYSNGAIPITVDTVETPDGTSALSFVLVPTGQAAPSAAQIQAGQNGLGGAPLDSGTVNWTGTPSITLATGIDEFCDIYLVIDNGALSNVGSDTNFEIDTTTPTLSALTGTQTGASTADWGATSDEAQGTIFAAARLATDAVLTKAEIENGTGNAVATSTDATPTADANNGGSFAGLSGSTNYIADGFQRDEFGNESAVVSSAQFTTAAGPSEQYETPATYNGQTSSGTLTRPGGTGVYRMGITGISQPIQIGVAVQDKNGSPSKTKSVVVSGTGAALVPGTRQSEASDNSMEVSWWEIGSQGSGALNVDVTTGVLSGADQDVTAQITVFVRQGFAATITGASGELAGAGTSTIPITNGTAGASLAGICMHAVDSGGGTLTWQQDTVEIGAEGNNTTSWPDANACWGWGSGAGLAAGTVNSEVVTTDFRAVHAAICLEP